MHALHFYGSAGIVSFGWALSRLLYFRCENYAPLWLAGALFVYNLDRLKRDPADAINTPRRLQDSARLRKISTLLAGLSAAALIIFPLTHHDWLMLVLTLGGGLFCLNYSIPLLGFRLKDIPFLKTFFAPTLVAAAYLAPPFLEQGLRVSAAHFMAVCAWTWCVLVFNMALCDLRDIAGDREMGTLSLPVFLGGSGILRALVLLLAIVVLLSCATLTTAPMENFVAWKWISAFVPVYLGGLLVACRKPRTEVFYEWWVEGILFLPAAIFLLATM